MKKIICIMIAVLLIACLAVPAYAVTPKYEFPDMPEISKIKFNISFPLGKEFWADWFEKHPITVPTYNLPSAELKERLQGLFD